MGGRRQSRSELPHAPLTLVHPLSVPGARVDGAPLLEELPRALAMPALQLLRAVLAWSRDPAETAAALNSEAVGALERRLLDRPRVQAPWAPLAVLAGAMAEPLTARPDQVSLACLAVSDWAIEARHERTALAYAEAAALAWPANARYAWVAGRMMRAHGRMKEAERWLRRAHRVAVWTDDWESSARSLNSLGVAYYITGRFGRAESSLTRALLIAERRGLVSLSGEILHDLFVLELERANYSQAEHYSHRAVERYLPNHHRLPALAHDLAVLWIAQGYFTRALAILEQVIHHIGEPAERFQVFAATARAAGGCGSSERFQQAWREAFGMLAHFSESRTRAAALVDLGLGASGLALWDQAIQALEAGLATARLRMESDVVLKAEAALEAARHHQILGRAAKHAGPRASRTGDSIAKQVISVLQPSGNTAKRELASSPA